MPWSARFKPFQNHGEFNTAEQAWNNQLRDFVQVNFELKKLEVALIILHISVLRATEFIVY